MVLSPDIACILQSAAINNLEELNLAISMGFDASNPFGPIENWDVSNCDSFFQAFKDAATFNEDISGWEVSSSTSFEVSTLDD